MKPLTSDALPINQHRQNKFNTVVFSEMRLRPQESAELDPSGV
jgi:hypothetical protein